MDKEKQRMVIAEASGWERIQTIPVVGLVGLPPNAMPTFENECLIPNYLKDLNRIQEVIKEKISPDLNLRVKFINTLRDICGRECEKNKMGVALVSDYDLIVARPDQLCEAFLKTIGKWEHN